MSSPSTNGSKNALGRPSKPPMPPPSPTLHRIPATQNAAGAKPANPINDPPTPSPGKTTTSYRSSASTAAPVINTNSGVGLANPSLSQGRRRMLDLVNKLHSTGVQVDIDLPQIAVIGSQSAGKSSLIESISGITLPRAAGTCTRCPTECRLAYSPNQWQCTVSLRFITDANGQPLGQARNELFGPTIYDKSQVEERIRRAQRAILNPSQTPKSFLGGDDEDVETPELSFSINCVSLQISGPDVADLSFCDLPGLIASVSSSRGSNNDIALVQNLVTSYIKKPSCIILLTVACESVLTKPDRIPTGEESNWLPFIRNEKESLENNWYCVKQPSSNDIKQNITWEGARKREHEFFASTPPWSELDPIYQKYLRTSNLVDRLSSILSDLIAKRLPEIQEELERSIVNTRKLLHDLPKAPSNDPTSEVVSLLHTFSRSLLEHVSGVPNTKGLIQLIRPKNERFRHSIRSTAPKFRPYERKYAGKRHIGPASFLRNEEDEVYEGEASEEDEPGSFVVSISSTTSSGSKRPRDDGKIYIDEVLERAVCARTRELPGNFPFVVQKSYIVEILKEWYEPAIRLCNQIYDILSEYVRELIHNHFAVFGQGHLEQRVRTIMQEHLKACRDRALERVEWLLEVEQQPFSLNGHYFDDYRTKFLTYYRGARRRHGQGDLMKQIASYTGTQSQAASPPPPSTGPRKAHPSDVYATQEARPHPIAAALAALAELGLHGVSPEDLPKLLPHDTMEPALDIMADVRAYFQVAYKRFTDNVPLAIDHELIRGAERGVLEALYTRLGIHGPNGQALCKELAQESPQIADRRADLLKKLERLGTANSELLNVGI